MCVPMAAAALALTAASSAFGVGSTIMNAQSQGAAASYQAAVARNNAIIADNNATYARQAGAVQEAQQRQKTAGFLGSMRTAQASNGFDVNSGSNTDLQAGAAAVGETDALTTRSNTARQVLGYETQSSNFTGQAGAFDAQGTNAGIAGGFGALGSVIGGASAFTNQKWQFDQKGVKY